MISNYGAWNEYLKDEFKKDYFVKMKNFLNEEYKNKTIFPPNECVFTIFDKISPKDIKVIILGQDPYHGVNQANGMSFSVNRGEKIPPSLRNIYLELYSDLGIIPPNHGDLTAWVEQGALEAEEDQQQERQQAHGDQRQLPVDHKDIGWQIFTDRVIEIISNFDYPKVFILWGSFAISKSNLIKRDENNFIITSTHPSPFSAHRGFFGSKPFSKANEFLVSKGVKPIDWRV